MFSIPLIIITGPLIWWLLWSYEAFSKWGAAAFVFVVFVIDQIATIRRLNREEDEKGDKD